MASISPIFVTFFLLSIGNLLAAIDIKTILSIPRIISKKVSVISANIASVGSIALEPVDLDSDGVLESTSVHLPNNSVLAIVQGTIDSAGNTLLSTHMLTLAEDG